jgi:hypothetical protein
MASNNQRQVNALVEKFNSLTKQLITDIKKRLPDDATVARTHSRIMLAISMNPLSVMGPVGGKLLEYRDQIYNINDPSVEAFLLGKDYATDVKNASADDEKKDLAKYLIPKAKECMRTMEEDKKKWYFESIVALLDTYIAYLDLLIK